MLPARRRIVDLALRALPGPAVVLGQRASELGLLGATAATSQVALTALSWRGGGRCGPARTPPPQPLDTVDHLGLARRLGVEAQRGSGVRSRCDRSATRLLGGPQLVDALGQQVERLGDLGQLGRGPGSARASPSPAASARAVPASSVASRVTERARRSAMTAARHQRQGDRSQRQPRRSTPASRRLGIRARTTDWSPPLTTTGV